MAIQDSPSTGSENAAQGIDPLGIDPVSNGELSGTGAIAVDTRPDEMATGAGEQAERLFSKSIVISGVRCLFTYLIFPFVTPFIGLAPGVGAGLGLVIGIVAIVANVFSIRRFWRADHRWKTPVTVLHLCVIGLLLVLAVRDILELVG